MKSKVQNIETLTQTIELLVASFIRETQEAANAAVERALQTSTVGIKPKVVRSQAGHQKVNRRSPTEIEQQSDDLLSLICKHPGESMSFFADKLGLTVRELNRPMVKLKSSGKIRSVGERNQTHYFPSVSK